jgi:predicted RNase H-related nuclease YkuK (DUF458 family)
MTATKLGGVMEYTFYNFSEQQLTIEDVYKRILNFIKKDPNASYRLAIGTDSQVRKDRTKFITAIHIHRIGKGAWGCLKNYEVPRSITSLREKISLETTLSQEIAYLFPAEKIDQLTDILLTSSNHDVDFYFEIHIDIGKKGVTKAFINDMVQRIEAMGLEAKIKPDSYAASSYADRYTK